MIAGALWGSLAYLLGVRAFKGLIWAGVLASPLIALGVGWVFQPLFERLSGFRRSLVALATVYAAVALFGLAMGTYDWWSGSASRSATEVVFQSVLTSLWGITFTGFLLFLWPLAYLTHAFLKWSDDA